MYRVVIELKDGTLLKSKQLTKSEARELWWEHYSNWGSVTELTFKPVSKDEVRIKSKTITSVFMEKEVKDETKSNENS